MKKIDVLDFDGTLYSKDSSVEFFKYCLKNNIFIIFFVPKIIICFLLYSLDFISIEKVKESFFLFLKYIKDIDKYVNDFWIINKKYIRYDLLDNCDNEIVVISASPTFLIEGICKELSIKYVIGSNFDKKCGTIDGANCKGNEKVNRLNDLFKIYEVNSFYSDSYSDIPLASIAINPYFINTDKVTKWNFNEKKKVNLKEIIRYLFIGFLTMLITLITYYLLTILILDVNIKVELQVANIVSWLLAAIFSYIFNRKYVFNSKNIEIKTEALMFICSRLLTLGIDMLGMYLLVSVLNYNDKVMKIIVQIIVVMLNYIISKFIVFRRKYEKDH